MNMSHSSVDFKVGDEGRISINCDGPACENLDAIKSFVEDNVDGAKVVGESTSSHKEGGMGTPVGMAIEVKPEKSESKKPVKGIKNFACGSVKKK